MDSILNAIILSLLPVSEVRGGIPVAIVQGVDPFIAFFVCVFSNCLAIPITFFFLNFLHKFFLKNKWYENFFNKHLEKARKNIEKSIGSMGEVIALMLFVGIPLPMTGAYTGTLLAWFFGIERKKAYFSICLGILIAAIIVMAITLGGIKTFSFFIK
jgi:uncharacterized membrane protein